MLITMVSSNQTITQLKNTGNILVASLLDTQVTRHMYVRAERKSCGRVHRQDMSTLLQNKTDLAAAWGTSLAAILADSLPQPAVILALQQSLCKKRSANSPKTGTVFGVCESCTPGSSGLTPKNWHFIRITSLHAKTAFNHK